MKLDDKEFKRFKTLIAKAKSKKISSAEQAELDELTAKKNEKDSNDVKWWDNYPELTKGACNIPFNFVPGVNPHVSFGSNPVSLSIPGLAVVHTLPTIGISKETSDAFNSQMRQLWLDMHRKYRGMGGYQRADLGMAILAIVGVFETLAKFERIYGVVNTYKIQNRHVPKSLYEGLGIAKDMGDVMANFRYGLNVRIAKLQQLCLPKGMAILQSRLINASTLFKDSANPRANLFCFDPAYYAIYDPTTLSTGGCVQYRKYDAEKQAVTPDGSNALSLQDMFRILDSQINALLDDDDIAKMCSDLIAAYGPENVETVTFVPELMVVEPVHDYERLLQFHNLTICGEIHSRFDASVVTQTQAATWNTNNVPVVVYQNDDVIINKLDCVDPDYAQNYDTVGQEVIFYCTMFEASAKTFNTLLDTWVDNPDKTEIMCGTRFTALTTEHTIGTGKYTRTIDSCGTDLVTDVYIYAYSETADIYTFTVLIGSEVLYSNLGVLDCVSLMAFDWHPLLYLTSSGQQGLLGDVDNFAVINLDELRALHNAAIYSCFKIPNVSYIS